MNLNRYIVMFFKASSGNECSIRATHRAGQNAVFSVLWKTAPSAEDIKDCDEWFPAAYATVTNQTLGIVDSVIEQDPAKRNAAARAFIDGCQEKN